MLHLIASVYSGRRMVRRAYHTVGTLFAFPVYGIPFIMPVCVIGALIARVAWILLVDAQPVSDFLWYYERAIDISSGRGYSINGTPTAYWPVGYPGILGLVFAVFGPSVVAGKVLNLILYLGVLFFAYQIAKKLFVSKFVGRVTLVVLSFYPNHIAYSSLLASEIFFLFLLLFGIALLIDGHRTWSTLISGIVFGLACLVKPQALLIPVIAIVFGGLGTGRGQLREKLKSLVIVYALLAVTILPWTIRNYFVFGDLVFVSTNGGINLFIGNNPEATGKYVFNDRMITLLGDTQDEHEKDLKATRLAVDYILKHPWKTMRLWPTKLWYLYKSDVEGISWNIAGSMSRDKSALAVFDFLKAIAQLYYMFIGIAFALSLFILLIKQRCNTRIRPFPVVGLYIILYFTLVCLIGFGKPRFHFPVMPWVVMYGAALVEELANWNVSLTESRARLREFMGRVRKLYLLGNIPGAS